MKRRTIQKDIRQGVKIREIKDRRNSRKGGHECSSLSSESVALQKEMFCSFGTLQTCTNRGGAVDKVVLIAMVAQVTEADAKLRYAANTNFVCGIIVRPWNRADSTQKALLKL